MNSNYNCNPCIDGICIDKEKLNMYENVVRSNKCVMKDISASSKFDNLPQDLNLCIDDKCLDINKIKKFYNITQKYDCIPNLPMNNDNNINLKICIDGTCVKKNVINELHDKMNDYKNTQQSFIIPKDESNTPMPNIQINTPTPSNILDQMTSVISTFVISDVDFDDISFTDMRMLEDGIKNAYASNYNTNTNNISVNFKPGSILVDVILNNINKRLMYQSTTNIRNSIVDNIKNLEITNINPYNISDIKIQEYNTITTPSTNSLDVNISIFSYFNDIIYEIIDDILKHNKDFLRKIINKFNSLNINDKKKFIKIIPYGIGIEQRLDYLDYKNYEIEFHINEPFDEFNQRMGSSYFKSSYLDFIKTIFEDIEFEVTNVIFGTNASEFTSKLISDPNIQVTFFIFIVQFSNGGYLPKIIIAS